MRAPLSPNAIAAFGRLTPGAASEPTPAGGTVDHIEPRSQDGPDVANNWDRRLPGRQQPQRDHPVAALPRAARIPGEAHSLRRVQPRLSGRRWRHIRRAFRRLDAIARAVRALTEDNALAGYLTKAVCEEARS